VPDTIVDATDVLRGARVLALTGAGISTDSGIPDYRGPDSPPRSPMTIAEFRSGPSARQRYWARSHIGWTHTAEASPNGGHLALAAMDAGVPDTPGVQAVITQNVDELHSRAGSKTVVDLHGRLSEVVCLDCGQVTSRHVLHERLDALNPDFDAEDVVIAPDGDAELESVAGFQVAPCLNCGGVLKPRVVFFGENVDRALVRHCYDLVEGADVLLVAGSSLAVLSGLRFVRHAHAQGIPVVIVNSGPTRGDDLAAVRIEGRCTPSLQAMQEALVHSR